jgi:hypothetical protein
MLMTWCFCSLPCSLIHPACTPLLHQGPTAAQGFKRPHAARGDNSAASSGGDSKRAQRGAGGSRNLKGSLPAINVINALRDGGDALGVRSAVNPCSESAAAGGEDMHSVAAGGKQVGMSLGMGSVLKSLCSG